MKNRIQKMNKKTQFNVRLSPDEKNKAVTLADAINESQEELARIAFAALMGTVDKVLRAKMEMAKAKSKELSLSFDNPGHQTTGIELAA